MATTPFVIDRFAGLDLVNDPQEVGASSAVDLLNVTFDQRGRLRTRDGYTLYSTPASTPPTVGVGYGTQFVIGCGSAGSNAQALASNGTSVAVAGWKALGLAKFGTPAASRVYAASTGGASYGYFDGAAWTLVLGGPPARRIAVTPWDNRMAAINSSKISFSNAGDADTWGANDFVQLAPGDSESLTGLCSWRDLLVAGKQSKLFVFYGTDTNGAGNPIFRYRTIDAGVGPVDALTITMCAGRDGIYFLAADGVYVFTGAGVPTRISQALDPWFRSQPMPSGSLPAFTGAFTKATIGAVGDYVYVAPEPGVSALTFVYHIPTGQWSAYGWLMQMCAVSPYATANGPEAMISLTDDKLYRHSGAYTSDNGSAISWSYRSGAYDMDQPGRVKMTLESRLWGIGSASLQVANELGTFDTGSSLTLGTSPQVADAWQQIDREGTLWQHKLSGSGQAVVSRLAHYISFVKPPGVQ